MKYIVKYLNCGYISVNNAVVGFYVIKFAEIVNKIIPFFSKYPIEGVKSKDFKDFC